MSDIVKCKYAGDKNDEFCCNCNGLSVVLNGQEHPATHCAGYEEEKWENVADAVEEKTETSPEATSDSPVDENKSDDKIIKEDDNTSKNDTEDSTVEESEDAVVTEICFSSGISKEINGVWYKFTCEERRVLMPGCNPAEEREKLWAMVNSEVDKQLLEAIKYNN